MTKSKRVSARLNTKTEEKLKQIIRKTGSNMSEVIERAIDVYFAESVQRKGSGWKALSEVGFIGCAEGPKDLSENYKNYLTDTMAKKL